MPAKKQPAKKAVAKKVTKKAVAKKSPAKKSTKKKSVVARACGCKKRCDAEQVFWVNNGPVVHSLEDLLHAVREMSNEQFAYHTKRNGNDFANWVRDCLADRANATKLRKARTRVGAVRVLTSVCSCR